jgi:hypothetical protein
LTVGAGPSAAVHRDVELVADGLQKLHHGELRVEDVGDVAALRDLLEEAPAHRRLAGADLAREQDEAAAAADAVEQVRQRLAVALAHVEITRVRRERERLLLQAEERMYMAGRIAFPAGASRLRRGGALSSAGCDCESGERTTNARDVARRAGEEEGGAGVHDRSGGPQRNPAR